MFSIENKIENGFAKIILKDSSNNTSAEIIPSCGAILHAFKIQYNNTSLNIIDHYDDVNDFINNVSAKGFKSCKLSPFACRIKNGNYTFGGINYSVNKFLLNGSALHGLLYDASFNIIAQLADEEKASVTVKHQYRGGEDGYPFHYDCIITYQLEKGNSLRIKTEVINKNNELMPLQDGWHPYFTFGGKIDDLQLEFQAKEKVEFDKDLIPTRKLLPYNTFNSLRKIRTENFDDCFTLNLAVPMNIGSQPLCVLRDPEKKIQLEISPGKNYPYLQIYTPSHRNSIAIENLSAAPDAFNNGMGLIRLAPQQTASFDTTFKVTLLH